jgi:hypothetical protein
MPRGGKRYVFELAGRLKEVRRFKPVIVAGYNVCILALLDEAMVGYGEVHEVVPPFQAVVVDGWRAERVLEAVGWAEGARDMYLLVACPVGDNCVFHLYGFDSEEELTATAAYMVMLATLDRLAGKALTLGLCREHDDCLGYVVSEVKALAPVYKPALLDHLSLMSEPHEIYCSREMLLEHKKGAEAAGEAPGQVAEGARAPGPAPGAGGLRGGEGEVPAGGH